MIPNPDELSFKVARVGRSASDRDQRRQLACAVDDLVKFNVVIRLGAEQILYVSDTALTAVSTDDRESVSKPLEVTAVSRIRRTQGIQEDTKGHDDLGD